MEGGNIMPLIAAFAAAGMMLIAGRCVIRIAEMAPTSGERPYRRNNGPLRI